MDQKIAKNLKIKYLELDRVGSGFGWHAGRHAYVPGAGTILSDKVTKLSDG
jgi:hypothetical protein